MPGRVRAESAPGGLDPTWVYQGTTGPGAGKHIVFLAGDHEYRVGRIAAGAGAHSRAALRIQVQRVLHDEPRDRVHRSRQLEHLGTGSAEDGRPPGRLPALPGFPRRPDAAHRRLPRPRRAGRRLPHGDARVSDPAAGREVPEVHLEGRRGLQAAASGARFSARHGSRTTARTTCRARRCYWSPDRQRIRSCAASRTCGCSRAATRRIRSKGAQSSRWGRSSTA